MEEKEKLLTLLAKGKKVLLCDDDPVILDIFKKVLSKYFKFIKTATNGHDAWQMYRKEKFDLVITDIEMPKTNGIMLSKGIRAKNPEQAILITSAYTEEKYLVELLNVGVDGFLKKPINLENLSTTILRVLNSIQLKQENQRIAFRKLLNTILNKNTEVKKSTYQQEVEKVVEQKTKQSVAGFLAKIKATDPAAFETFQAQQAEMLEAIDELSEVYDTLCFKHYEDNSGIQEFARLLHIIHRILDSFEHLQQESVEIERLARIIESIHIENLQEHQMDAFDILEFLLNDIRNFIYDMFVDKNVEDVNYFIDSFKENINHFNNTLTAVNDDREDNLEFF
jgi:YesN/AraC family two-component response regulator